MSKKKVVLNDGNSLSLKQRTPDEIHWAFNLNKWQLIL